MATSGGPTPDDLFAAYARDVERSPTLTGAREVELGRAMERAGYLLRLRDRLSRPEHLGRDPDAVDLGFAMYAEFKRSWGLVVAVHDRITPVEGGERPSRPAMLATVLPLTKVPGPAVDAACETLGGIAPDDLEESLRLRAVEWDLFPANIRCMLGSKTTWPDDDIALGVLTRFTPNLASDFADHIVQGALAKETLTEANLRLVIREARSSVGLGIAPLEAVQAGNLELVRAVERFRHHRGVRFSAYATPRIRRAIALAIADATEDTAPPVAARAGYA